MNLSPQAQQLLALQQAKYLRSLPDKKARLENAWNAVKQQGWTPELTEILQTGVHRLSGSAGSYGLHSLGKVARQLDLLLSGSSSPKAPSAALDADFGRLMEALFLTLDKDIKDSIEHSELDSGP